MGSIDKKSFIVPGLNYYEDTYGVSVMSDRDLIEMKVDRRNAPYVVTKPFHTSQRVLGEFPDGSILLGLKLHHNFEFERLILGFGPAIIVLKPRRLRQKIRKLISQAHHNYCGEAAS